MNSNEVFNLIEQIAASPGKNDKVALLSANMHDGDFAEVIRYALDPFITFGIRPKRRVFESVNRRFTPATFELLDKLAARTLTGDAAKYAVNDELTALDADSSELLWRIINKDLKAGFSESSVNKASKGFFKEFPYQRCSLPKDVKLKDWPWATGIISQLKADGMYTDIQKDEDFVQLLSRAGQPFSIEPFADLMAELQRIDLPASHLHGELVVMGPDGKICAREIGNGMLNKAIQGTNFADGYYPVLQLWDAIPKSACVAKGKYVKPYLQRLRALTTAIKTADVKLVSIIETRIVRSLKEAYAHYSEKLKEGMEGTVIKLPLAIWKDGTSKEQVKLKLEAPCELEVVGFEEGKEGAKTAKTFGSLKLRSHCGKLEVNCGTGFSDALRKEINDNREDWMGAIITLKANSIMWSTDDSPNSLFLPVFLERRYDKHEADDMEQIVYQFENAIELVLAAGE